jgi:hypothetical protein
MPNWKKLIVSGSDASLNNLTVNNQVNASTFTGSLLRLDENGTGLRMTNIGAFDNSSGNFRIFSTNDLILSTNGDSGTALTIDATSKDATFQGDVTADAFIGDGSALTNISAQVTEQATITDTFTSVTSKAITHNFGTKNVLVSVYNSSDELIIPASTVTTDTNVVTITFDVTTTGRAVVAKGGHLVSGSAVLSGTGVFSGSAQIDAVTRYEESITGASTYNITHNLGEDYPIVQVYDNNKFQAIPGIISASNANSVYLEFDSNFTGRVVIKK